jgi:predicted helicase
MVGVAIMFLVKKQNPENEKCKINYVALDDFWRKEQKLQWLAQHPLRKISFEFIRPDKKNNWINIPDNDFENLFPLFNTANSSLFNLDGLGVSTNRDEWVFDPSKKNLMDKIKYFNEHYTKQLKLEKTDNNSLDYSIKWSESLKNHLKKRKKMVVDKSLIIKYNKRPFYKVNYYSDKMLSDRLTTNHYQAFGDRLCNDNLLIAVNTNGIHFEALSSKTIVDLHFTGDTRCLPLYRYDKNGARIENITDWGLQQFVNQYNDNAITKQDIFHYVYAVLHNPVYRKKYELNLKREFPRIPFYDNFHQWAKWGEELMNLHVNYEKVEPFQLRITNYELREDAVPKVKLKADKKAGSIILDDQTELHDIPAVAWNYKLGNRSALEWILDQYQERKPQDQTIAEQFDTYRFADYKEEVIDLLQRVCTVSIETMKIMDEMERCSL